MSDSGSVRAVQKSSEPEKKKTVKEESGAASVQASASPEQQMLPARPVKLSADARMAVSFPAILPTEGYLTRGFEPEHNHFGLDIAGKADI